MDDEETGNLKTRGEDWGFFGGGSSHCRVLGRKRGEKSTSTPRRGLRYLEMVASG